MGDLLNGYAPVAAYDELFECAERPRPHALALHDALQTLSPADFARAELEFVRVTDLVRTLPGHLEAVQRSVAEIHDAIAKRYFLAERVVEWSA